MNPKIRACAGLGGLLVCNAFVSGYVALSNIKMLVCALHIHCVLVVHDSAFIFIKFILVA